MSIDLKFRYNNSQVTDLKRTSVQLFTEFQISFLISINYAYFKNELTEIQWIYSMY